MRVGNRDEIAFADVGGAAGYRSDRCRAAALTQERNVGVDAVLLEDAEVLRVKRFRIHVLSGIDDVDGRQSRHVRALNGHPAENDRGGYDQRPRQEQ